MPRSLCQGEGASTGHDFDAIWREAGPAIWRAVYAYAGGPFASTIAKGDGVNVDVEGRHFLIVHAPGGYYALEHPFDDAHWDVASQEVVETDGSSGDELTRWDRDGNLVSSHLEGVLVHGPLDAHPAIVAWDGHLLVSLSAASTVSDLKTLWAGQ